MIKRRHERSERRVPVDDLCEDERRARRIDIDAVTDHGARVDGMAEAGAGPHFGAVEDPGEEGEGAEPGEAGRAVAAAPAPEARDGDCDGGEVVAEEEEGSQVRVHAAGAAAALAGPDEVVEFAGFGAFRGGGLVVVGGWGGGEGALEGGELGFGGAEGGGEVREAGEEVGVGLEVGGLGGCGEGLGGRGGFGG